MRLARPFYRLPLHFDADRMRAEVAALPAEAWSRHPQEYEGNTAARLITVDGLQNDAVSGAMRPTPALLASPYLRQALCSFRTVWSRSRLMRLAAGATVPRHSDVNYHWYYRVRVHIPIITRPEVRFQAGEESVHMSAGEAWIFDNWRQHEVHNPTAIDRIHLVADTTGTSAFWQLVAQGQSQDFDQPNPRDRVVPFDPSAQDTPMLETFNSSPVMPPAEVEQLAFDILGNLQAAEDGGDSGSAVAHFAGAVVDFCRDWRSLWSLYGANMAARGQYEQVAAILSRKISKLPVLVVTGSGVNAQFVLNARVLAHLFADSASGREAAEFNVVGGETGKATATAGFTGNLVQAGTGPLPASATAADVPATDAGESLPAIERPIIILSAPRAGSTLLFETLAQAAGLFTIGDESHELIESIDSLRPGGGTVDSNRLVAADATPSLVQELRRRFASALRDRDGRIPDGASPVRMLEKTPKNTLRIPFLLRVFPDALFVFLHRDPRASLSSMMQAWRSGRWVTYRRLPGWDGDWSLLLPPAYSELRGHDLEEIVATQWRVSNETVLSDLESLPPDRWTTVRYESLIENPRREIERLLAFAGLQMDAGLADYLSRPLPNSRYTLSAPDPLKWRRNATEISRVLPSLAAVAQRLGRSVSDDS